MTPRAQRTLWKFVEYFLGTGALLTAYQLLTQPAVDWRALGAALLAGIIAAGTKYLAESNTETAAPTTEAVNAALQNAAPSVAPPTVSVPRPTLVVPDPSVPPPGV